MYDIDELRTKNLLTRKEAAFYMGIGLSTLQSLTYDSGFPALRVGKRRVLIHREKLDKWLDERANN